MLFYVGETGCALNFRINNHRHFCNINKPDASVSLHTESSQHQVWSIFPGCHNPHFTPYNQHLNTPSKEGCLYYSWFKRENLSWPQPSITLKLPFLYIFNTFPSTIPPCTYTVYSCKLFQAPEIYALQQSVLQTWCAVH